MNSDGPVLRDIHLPADPAWWPPAPGWWLLLAIALLTITAVVVLLRRGWRRRQWHGRVMAELEQISKRHDQARDPVGLLGEISLLLRRASRLIDPSAASLRGEDWLRFLDSVPGGEHFSAGLGRCLLDGPYQRQVNVDADALIDLTRSWLRQALTSKATHV